MVFSWCASANTSHLLCSSNVKTGKIEIKFMIILSTVCGCRVWLTAVTGVSICTCVVQLWQQWSEATPFKAVH